MNSNVRFWVILIAAIVVVVVLTAGSGDSGPPFSPRSVDPDGAKGLVEVLEDLGADVRLGQPLPESTDTAALMLEDRLRPDDRDELKRWIDAGGVLVVADPFSTFLPRRMQALPDIVDRDNCSIEALQDVRRLELPPDAWSLDTNFDSACIGSSAQAFVVATPSGDGAIVAVGSRHIFTNAWLDEADAAVLAVSVLAPDPQSASVAFLGPSLAAFGDDDTDDLIATRVSNSLLMLAAAFALYAIHRARRVGGVVAEPLPVHLHGSEVVLRAGLLSERANDPGSAADSLRDATLLRARSALAIDPTADREHAVTTIAQRVGRPPQELHDLLVAPVTSDAQLVEVAQELTQIEHELFNPDELAGRAPSNA